MKINAITHTPRVSLKQPTPRFGTFYNMTDWLHAMSDKPADQIRVRMHQEVARADVQNGNLPEPCPQSKSVWWPIRFLMHDEKGLIAVTGFDVPKLLAAVLKKAGQMEYAELYEEMTQKPHLTAEDVDWINLDDSSPGLLQQGFDDLGEVDIQYLPCTEEALAAQEGLPKVIPEHVVSHPYLDGLPKDFDPSVN